MSWLYSECLLIFANFACLFLIYFGIYSARFFKLLNKIAFLLELKHIFRLYMTPSVLCSTGLIWNLPDDLSTDVQVLHVAFVFLITILLMNFLIATPSSSSEHIMNYRKLFVRMQLFSISILTDGHFQTFLPRLRDYLHRRYFIHWSCHSDGKLP